MIKDIISFVTANQKFAIDFQITPIILRASDYLSAKKSKSNSENEKIHFEGEIVDIIDLAWTLKLGKSSLIDTSRILVGEIDGKLVGLLVDKVLEIINLNGDSHELNDSLNTDPFLEVSGEKLRLVDLKLLLKKSKSNIILD